MISLLRATTFHKCDVLMSSRLRSVPSPHPPLLYKSPSICTHPMPISSLGLGYTHIFLLCASALRVLEVLSSMPTGESCLAFKSLFKDTASRKPVLSSHILNHLSSLAPPLTFLACRLQLCYTYFSDCKCCQPEERVGDTLWETTEES